jgi:hypothetical protein
MCNAKTTLINITGVVSLLDVLNIKNDINKKRIFFENFRKDVKKVLRILI